MLLGCCHCGDEPPSESDSIPPSESTPPSESASDSDQSESDSSYSESIVDIDCVNIFGCEAVPRFLRWEVEVTKPADACPCAYMTGGTFKLEFYDCTTFMPSGVRALRYASAELMPFKHPDLNFFCIPGTNTGFTGRLWTMQLQDNTVGDINILVRTGQVELAPSYTFITQFGTWTDKASCLFNTIPMPVLPTNAACGFINGVLSPW
jgi:hypothetical protein